MRERWRLTARELNLREIQLFLGNTSDEIQPNFGLD